MSFKIKDVKKYKRNLSPEKEKKWQSLANSASKQCVAAGGDTLECEITAVRIANEKLSGKNSLSEAFFSEAKKRAKDFKKEIDSDKGFNFLSLQEAEPDDDKWQLALPIGAWYVEWYGEVIFTRTFMEELVKNYKRKVLNERQPYIDTDHDGGAANGWITDMQVGDDGVEIKVDWTERGRELLEKGIYKYYSATIQSKLDIETNERIWPVMPMVTLTNRPAMNQMPPAQLADKKDFGDKLVDEIEDKNLDDMENMRDDFNYVGTVDEEGKKDFTKEVKDFNNSTHGDGENQSEVNDMKLAEVLSFIVSLSDEEKRLVAKECGFSNNVELTAENGKLKDTVTRLEGEKDVLTKVNNDLTAQVKTFTEKDVEARKKSAIEKALREGRMLPKDREYWEGKFDENPDFTEEVVNKLAKVVDLTDRGTEDSQDSDTADEDLSDEYKEVVRLLKNTGMTEEQIKEVL